MAMCLRKIAFLLSLCCTTLAVARDVSIPLPMAALQGDYPSWIERVADKKLWLGISPPTKDRHAARNLALQNAILYYLCANRGGTLQSAYSCHEKIQQESLNGTLMEEIIERSSEEVVRLTFNQFSAQVVYEYYNRYGECFIACEIKPDKNSGNAVVICRNWTETENESGNMRFELASSVNGVEMICSLIVSYSEDGVSFTVKSENVEFMDYQNWEYPTIQLSSLREAYGYSFSTNQSLGVSQMACLAMSPFVTDNVTVKGMSSSSSENDGKILNCSATTITAEGESREIGVVLQSMRHNDWDVVMKTPLEDVADEGCFLLVVGCSHPFHNRPLSLSKLSAYYSALPMASKYQNLMNDTPNLVLEEKIRIHDIDWCFEEGHHDEILRCVRIILNMKKF